MKRLMFLVILAAAGCGADGDPVRPTANVGLSVGSGGVDTYTSVGATNGIVSVGVGI